MSVFSQQQRMLRGKRLGTRTHHSGDALGDGQDLNRNSEPMGKTTSDLGEGRIPHHSSKDQIVIWERQRGQAGAGYWAAKHTCSEAKSLAPDPTVCPQDNHDQGQGRHQDLDGDCEVLEPCLLGHVARRRPWVCRVQGSRC